MKLYFKKIIIALVVLSSQMAISQVGIGVTSPNGALDITSANNGVLLPRLALSAKNIATVLTPTVSEIVYNTATSGVGVNQVTPGFYYWNGSLWINLTANSNDWSLTGNTGTTPGTNFIGTIDTQDFVVKTDNAERIRVASNGKVGIGENNPADALLEVGGNLIVGNTYTGGNSVAQPGGVTIEGRTIIGEDDFYYTSLDKFVVYGNTNWIPSAVTNGDNGSGLLYAVNAYTSNGVGLYAEDNDGGIGVNSNVSGTATNRATAVSGLDKSGTGYGVIGISRNNSTTSTNGYIGVQGFESTTTGFALLASGDVGYTGGFVNLSDRRLKKNIQPIKGALNIINKINPKNYDMRWEKYKSVGLARTPQMGFIAQELEQVLPHLVSNKNIPLNNHVYSKKELAENPEFAKKNGDDLDVKMVNYVQMIPLLTQAIKEQQILIEELQSKVSQLEK